MDFQTSAKTCFNKYATFSGRAARSEFWYWKLFWFVSYIALIFVDKIILNSAGAGPLAGIFALAAVIPDISVSVRRLHDTNRSGWWWWIVLIPLIGGILLIVWLATRGTAGDNRFGPDPLAPQMIG